MTGFVAKRVRFRNGEHHSILSRPEGLPVHEATLYLANYRKRGRAANTIHAVCMVLALLYRELAKTDVDLLQRLSDLVVRPVPDRALVPGGRAAIFGAAGIQRPGHGASRTARGRGPHCHQHTARRRGAGDRRPPPGAGPVVVAVIQSADESRKSRTCIDLPGKSEVDGRSHLMNS